MPWWPAVVGRGACCVSCHNAGMSLVKIATFVPLTHADAVRAALGAAGAGAIGEYSYCSFSVTGVGRFVPGAGTHPHIGEVGALTTVTEERIEVVCARDDARAIVTALRAAHPYEEPAIDIYALLDLDDL